MDKGDNTHGDVEDNYISEAVEFHGLEEGTT